jgi:hypothetical protein
MEAADAYDRLATSIEAMTKIPTLTHDQDEMGQARPGSAALRETIDGSDTANVDVGVVLIDLGP